MTLLSNHNKHNFVSLKYDRVSKNYDFSRSAGKEDSDLLFKLLDPLHDASVLEVGCGTGNYLERLNDKPTLLVGLDISRNMLVKAKSKLPDLMLIQSNAEYLPFSEDSFDAIYCIQVLHHILDKNKFISEIHRTLKQGGKFVLQTCSHEQLLSFCFYHYFTHACDIDLKRFPPISDIYDLFAMAGFTDILSHSCHIDDAVDDSPAAYLEKRVRDGCSTFAFLTTKEIQEGCKKIKQDIISGKVSEVVTELRNKTEQIGGNATFIKGIKT